MSDSIFISGVLPWIIVASTLVVAVAAWLLALCALERLALDVLSFLRGIFFAPRVFPASPKVSDLIARPEKTFALLCPVWRNGEGLGRHIDELIATLDYSSYHVFISVHPNDTLALRESEKLMHRHQHVHRVICHAPGPATWSSTIAALMDGVDEFERVGRIEFQGFVVANVRDQLHPLAIRLLNYGLEFADLVEIPRYASRTACTQLFAGAAHDQLAELHGSENELRATLSSSVPLIEVMSGFNRALQQN